MKLVKRKIERDGSGFIVLTPVEVDDLFAVYQILAPGDRLKTSTYRRVQTETTTGSRSSNRIKLTLEITVESVLYEPTDAEIRVSGPNLTENENIKLGAYHTHTVQLNTPFTLTKDRWDSIYLERVAEACDEARVADVAAVIMQEGLAFVCLITPSMTIVRQKIEFAIARKRKGSVDQHGKTLNKFFDAVIAAVLTHVDFSLVKCCILASPGFVRDNFFAYMMERARVEDTRVLLDNRAIFLRAHASSGHKHALKEVLANPAVGAMLSETKASREVAALAEFYETLRVDEARAVYGFKSVSRACELNAIATLLVTDELFRAAEVARRVQYVALVEAVRANGGTVFIFSTQHVSGEQLGQLTGVAAVLRFPLGDEDDNEAVDSDSYVTESDDE